MANIATGRSAADGRLRHLRAAWTLLGALRSSSGFSNISCNGAALKICVQDGNVWRLCALVATRQAAPTFIS